MKGGGTSESAESKAPHIILQELGLDEKTLPINDERVLNLPVFQKPPLGQMLVKPLMLMSQGGQ